RQLAGGLVVAGREDPEVPALHLEPPPPLPDPALPQQEHGPARPQHPLHRRPLLQRRSALPGAGGARRLGHRPNGGVVTTASGPSGLPSRTPAPGSTSRRRYPSAIVSPTRGEIAALVTRPTSRPSSARWSGVP